MTPEQVLFAITRGNPVEVSAEDWPAAKALLLDRVALWEQATEVSPVVSKWIADVRQLIADREG